MKDIDERYSFYSLNTHQIMSQDKLMKDMEEIIVVNDTDNDNDKDDIKNQSWWNSDLRDMAIKEMNKFIKYNKLEKYKKDIMKQRRLSKNVNYARKYRSNMNVKFSKDKFDNMSKIIIESKIKLEKSKQYYQELLNENELLKNELLKIKTNK